MKYGEAAERRRAPSERLIYAKCASVKSGSSGDSRYGKYNIGFTARPLRIVMKWSCGPVVNPVMPT